METIFRYPSLFLLAFFIHFLTVLSLTEDDHDQNPSAVFTLDMIHCDLPASPFYNPSKTHWQRLSNALRRSHHRHRFKSGKVEKTALIFSGGEYLMNISIGKLSKPFNDIVDTGSDLIWT
ncbi:putative nepenthesin [Rosa chinensis]|uniref:Putative nepenthesin n=1 Tax=Rosa chinensis TaxID=74649 RepID=A0A2P6SE70_ROSCH|nr:putative nepenthesin [Rosa chinensis]